MSGKIFNDNPNEDIDRFIAWYNKTRTAECRDGWCQDCKDPKGDCECLCHEQTS